MFPGEPAWTDEGYRWHMTAALCVGALLVGFLACVELIGEVRFAPERRAARAAPPDPDSLDAIALVQDWQPAGDEETVLRRLAGAVRNPAYPRAWSAEKTEGASYLVIFREPAGAPAYAFEVNLETESVEPTPEAVERLTMLRLREEMHSPRNLIVRAP